MQMRAKQMCYQLYHFPSCWFCGAYGQITSLCSRFRRALANSAHRTLYQQICRPL